MEGPSNGGMLYHESQESKLCAVHCVNAVLQGPFFSEFDLAALAADLDRRERMVMPDDGSAGADVSHNVSLGGDFSIQVLEKALEVWDLQVIPLGSPNADSAKIDPELENAFICHLEDHWFCIRKVGGEWYNFDSLYAAPEHLSKFYLSAYLDTLKGYGWSIFLVRGNFPHECPLSASESSNKYGLWISPEDAQRITKSCNERNNAPQRVTSSVPPSPAQFMSEADQIAMIAFQEEEDLNAAIAASLMDCAAPGAVADNRVVDPVVVGVPVEAPKDEQNLIEPVVVSAEPQSPQEDAGLNDSASPPKEENPADSAAHH